jgi:NTE family protein
VYADPGVHAGVPPAVCRSGGRVRGRRTKGEQRATAASPATAAGGDSGAGALDLGRAVVRRARADPRLVLAIASVGVFMAFLDDTVVTIAFPNIIRSFPGARLSELSWVLNAYNIVFAALMIPSGRLADLFGRRRVFIAGLGLFTIGSAFAAAAPSLGTLIAARALQGAGAAVLVPASLAIVLEAYPGPSRTGAVALWSATAAVAVGLGPSLGGALVTLGGWPLVFLINLPIGLAAVWGSRRGLVESRAPGRRAAPDLVGGLALTAGLAVLTLAIVEGPAWGWGGPAVIASAAAGIVILGGLAQRARHNPDTVIDVDLLSAPAVRMTSALTFVGASGVFAFGVANVLLLMLVWRWSPLHTGLAATPAPLVGALVAGATGRLAGRFDSRRLMFGGAVVWTAAPLFLLARATVHPDFLGVYLPATLLSALGLGVAFPLVSDAAVAAAPRGRFAGATGLNGAVRQVGAALGIAILTALVAGAGTVDILAGYRSVWWFAAGCFAACAALCLFLRPLPHAAAADGAADLAARRRAAIRRPSAALASAPRRTASPAALVSDEELLRDAEIVRALSPDARRELLERAQLVRLAAGEWLLREGETADAAYIVRSGRIEALRQRGDGPPETLAELGRGSVVGELALLAGSTRAASIRGRRDATLLRIDRETFDTLLADPAVAGAVVRELAARLQGDRNPLPAGPSRIKTIAIVRRWDGLRAADVEQSLLRALAPLADVFVVDRAAVAAAAPDEPVGVALAQVLDRVETQHELVVLRAAAPPGDPWIDSCLRQADRTVLLIDRETPAEAARLGGDGLAGCDAVLLDPPDVPEVAALLDTLAPRSAGRVRDEHDITRVARRLAGRAVGLILSGGGARTFAHIGVFEELQAAGVVIDRIGGASMGAFVGALLASGMDADEAAARCYLEFVRRNPMRDWRFPRTSLIRGAHARAMLERNLPGLIEDLPLPYFCVTVDVISARLVVHRRGDLATAVAGTLTVPGLAPPVALGRSLLVDGGIFDNLPVSTMLEEGEGPIIASYAGKPEQRTLAPDEPLPHVGLVDMLMRVMFLNTIDTAEQASRADLVISPEREFVNWTDFHMLDRMRDAGRRAALEALEDAPSYLFP